MNDSSGLRTLAVLVTVALLSLNIGCSPDQSPALRVGISAWPSYEFLYLAQEKGFYRDEGVEVRIVEFDSLSEVRRGYERGLIDALGATVIEVLEIREHSPRSPQIVQVVDYSDGADVVLARPGITNGAGLRGGRIGLELGSLGVYVLARSLEKSELSFADVTLVSMDQFSMADALRKGKVDAVVTYPPISIKLLRDGNVNTLFSTAEIPGEVVDVIAVEAEVIAKHPKDIAGLLRAYRRAIAYAQQNPTDAYRVMAERENLTPEEFRAALTTGIRLLSASEQAAYLRAGGTIAAIIDRSDQLLRQNGQIRGPDRRGTAATATFAAEELS